MPVWKFEILSGGGSFDFVTDRIEGDYALQLTGIRSSTTPAKVVMKFIKEELREAQIISWVRLQQGPGPPSPALLIGHTSYGELLTSYKLGEDWNAWGDWWLMKCSFYYAEDYDVKRAELGYIDTETNEYHVLTSKSFGTGAPEPGHIYFGYYGGKHTGTNPYIRMRADLTQINFGREYFE
ncbi:MAG: hypothetical protein ACXQTW_08585 [Candidatus Methanospirareceae archaeon]